MLPAVPVPATRDGSLSRAEHARLQRNVELDRRLARRMHFLPRWDAHRGHAAADETKAGDWSHVR